MVQVLFSDEVECPSCYNPIEPGWRWCHLCGYDPQGVNPEGTGPSPRPKGAPAPAAPVEEPEPFRPHPAASALANTGTAGAPAPSGPVRVTGDPRGDGTGASEPGSFGPSGGDSAQAGPFEPPELRDSRTGTTRVLSPIGIACIVVLVVCVVAVIVVVLGGFNP